jgi:hypothetical protein
MCRPLTALIGHSIQLQEARPRTCRSTSNTRRPWKSALKVSWLLVLQAAGTAAAAATAAAGRRAAGQVSQHRGSGGRQGKKEPGRLAPCQREGVPIGGGPGLECCAPTASWVLLRSAPAPAL